QEQAGVGRKQMRDRLGRGVRAVRGAECVVDVDVAAVRELACEARVVLRLPRVEARVLEHAYARVGQELAQPPLDRRHAEGVVDTLRPPEVRAHVDLRRVALEQQLEGRKRGANARVVGDVAVLERDVQVRADQNGFAGDVGFTNGTRYAHLRGDGGRHRLRDLRDQIDETAAVAPLVVVPAED